jgi:hypothetical protein
VDCMVASIIRTNLVKWAGHVTRMGEMRNTCKILEKLKGRDLLGVPEAMDHYSLIVLMVNGQQLCEI